MRTTRISVVAAVLAAMTALAPATAIADDQPGSGSGPGRKASLDLTEFVPEAGDESSKADGASSGKKDACTKQSGPHQRQVEEYLKLLVDGSQSPEDCQAIKVFQTANGITPNTGYAGPVTWGRMQLEQARSNPNAAKKCPTRAGQRVVCVDLNRQLLWVQRGKKVTFGPVPARTGRRGYGTRVGWHRVYERKRNQVSEIYGTKMPFSQFFSGGQALHAISGKGVYTPGGSYGCVNLAYDDARRLWSALKLKDRVYVWGRKPGT